GPGEESGPAVANANPGDRFGGARADRGRRSRIHELAGVRFDDETQWEWNFGDGRPDGHDPNGVRQHADWQGEELADGGPGTRRLAARLHEGCWIRGPDDWQSTVPSSDRARRDRRAQADIRAHRPHGSLAQVRLEAAVLHDDDEGLERPHGRL